MVMDLTGQIVYQSINAENILDLSTLSNGIYLIKNDFGFTQQLVIQN
jgi:hypothetical protein